MSERLCRACRFFHRIDPAAPWPIVGGPKTETPAQHGHCGLPAGNSSKPPRPHDRPIRHETDSCISFEAAG